MNPGIIKGIIIIHSTINPIAEPSTTSIASKNVVTIEESIIAANQIINNIVIIIYIKIKRILDLHRQSIPGNLK